MEKSPAGLSGWPARIAFLLAVFLSGATALVVCRATPEHGMMALKLLLLMCFIGVIGMSNWASSGSYFMACVLVALLHGPMLVYIMCARSPLLYLVALTVWIAALLLMILDQAMLTTKFNMLYALWVVTGLAFTLGHLGVPGNLDWPRYIGLHCGVAPESVRWFWDTRILVSSAMVLVLLATSVADAFGDAVPDIQGIGESPRMSTGSSGIVGALTDPFVILANALLWSAWALAELVWIATASILVYMWRIMAGMAEHLIKATFDTAIWRVALRGCCAGLLVYSLGATSRLAAPVARSYLLCEGLSGGALELATLAGFVVMTTIALSLHTFLIRGEGLRPILESVSRGHASLAVAYFCAGILLHVLVWTALTSVPGFSSLGAFSVTTIVVLGVIIASQLWARVA